MDKRTADGCMARLHGKVVLCVASTVVRMGIVTAV
jgi:hypothetical protein